MPKTNKKNKKPTQKNKTKVKQKQKQRQSQNINITIDQSKKTNPRQPSQGKAQPNYAGPSIRYVSAPLQQTPQPVAQPVPQPSNPLFGSDYNEFKNSLNSRFNALDSNLTSFRDNVNDFMEKVKTKDRDSSQNNINAALSSVAQTSEERGIQTNPISFYTSYTSPDYNYSYSPTESLYTPQQTPPQTPSFEKAIIRYAQPSRKTKEKPAASEFTKPKTLFEDIPKLNLPSTLPRSFFDVKPEPEPNKLILALEDVKPEPEQNKIISAIEDVKEDVKNESVKNKMIKKTLADAAKQKYEEMKEQEQMGKEEEYMKNYDKEYKLIHQCPFCSDSKHYANPESLFKHMRNLHNLTTTLTRDIKKDGNDNLYRLGKKENGVKPINYLYDEKTINDEINLRRGLINKMSIEESMAIAREAKKSKAK